MKDELGEEIPAPAESDPICLAAVRDLNGDGKFAADGSGDEDGDGIGDGEDEDSFVSGTLTSGQGSGPNQRSDRREEGDGE